MQKSECNVRRLRMCVLVLCLCACCGEVDFERLGELVGLAGATSLHLSSGNVHFTATTTVPCHTIYSDDALNRVWRSYMRFGLKSKVCENTLPFPCSCSSDNKESENAARIQAQVRELQVPFSTIQEYVARRRFYKCLRKLNLIQLTDGA
jgi:hypothetical protein